LILVLDQSTPTP
jgi:hypothetical protein